MFKDMIKILCADMPYFCSLGHIYVCSTHNNALTNIYNVFKHLIHTLVSIFMYEHNIMHNKLNIVYVTCTQSLLQILPAV